MSDSLDLDVGAARKRIAPHVRRTPVLRIPGGPDGPPVALKLESLQVTGSFKLRGAANTMSALAGLAEPPSVVACSSGNHGQAVAHMAGRLGLSATICVPDWVDSVKLDAIRAAGATVELAGSTYDAAEARADELAHDGARMIHPFDDPLVIEGQATVAAEILEQAPWVETVAIPLSGGGLAGGMATVLRAAGKRVVAVSAQAANVMVQSLQAGRPIECAEEETLATALSGGIGLHNAWSFDLVRTLIDEHASVTEAEIAQAMRWCYLRGLVVEGGGAVGVGAWLAGKLDADAATTLLVVSGGNLDTRTLSRVVTGEQ